MLGWFAIVTFAVVAGGCGSSGYGGRAIHLRHEAGRHDACAHGADAHGDRRRDLGRRGSRNPSPAPRDLRVAAATTAGVRLTWTDPEPVTAKHTYGDTIVSYRVHRKAPGELQFVPIATTTAPTYTDPTVESGKTYAYSVVDVRDQGVESGLSEPVEVTVPSRTCIRLARCGPDSRFAGEAPVAAWHAAAT